MEATAYSRSCLKDIADIRGFQWKNRSIRYDNKDVVRVNRFILSPDFVTSRYEGPNQLVIIPKKESSLKREFLSFIFELGAFYAHLAAKQGKKRTALVASELDLMNFDIPLPSPSTLYVPDSMFFQNALA